MSGCFSALVHESILLFSSPSTEGSKEAEHLRGAVLMGRARLKEAELEAERWAEQGRRLQSHAQTQSQEITQLKQERLGNQETINR